MTLVRRGKGGEMERVHSDMRRPDLEADDCVEMEYAWDWSVAGEFVCHFNKKFGVDGRFSAKYETGYYGTCQHYGEKHYVVFLRPTLRGQEAWRTLFHELAHAITKGSAPSHGDEFKSNVFVVYGEWKEFVRAATDKVKDLIIQMVLNYGIKKGKMIGMCDGKDPWGKPWGWWTLNPKEKTPGGVQ